MRGSFKVAVGKLIDAEFGGHHADDRYCGGCCERFPRRSALCPRCGGALTLWATHVAIERRQRSSTGRVWRAALALLLFVALLLLAALRVLAGLRTVG